MSREDVRQPRILLVDDMADTRTLFAGTRLIYGEGPALELFVVEGFDCLFGFIRGAHLDEAEAAGFARGAIEDDVNCYNLAHGAKMILQVIFGRVVVDVTNE